MKEFPLKTNTISNIISLTNVEINLRKYNWRTVNDHSIEVYTNALGSESASGI